MNDVAEEQKVVVFRVEGVAGATGSMPRQRNRLQPLGHEFAVSYRSQQGPELSKVWLSVKAVHGRLGYRDLFQVRKEHSAVRGQKPVQMILMCVSQRQNCN